MSPKRRDPAEPQGRTGPPKAGKPNATKPDEMSADLLEFIQAIDDYKRLHQRPFPSWSEILEILKTLGYERAGR